ncbi:response regulator transcription factor [Alteromonas lipotrueiana]|uniref:response regulator transcription factor n=1 Tax=Alteromonas lipotrueiana TaxID=2803815 RepID=UPI001C486BEA|nr:response regulator [Alteromonas lipotrueiana]
MSTQPEVSLSKTSGLHVLVIENEPVTASVITSVMSGLGWTVDFAASGKAAKKLQQRQTYDVVLLDVTLPDIEGGSLYQQIKSQHGTALPVLLINALSEQVCDVAVMPEDDIVPDAANTRDIIYRCQTLASASADVAMSA